jgi:hypothetical protein
MTLSAASVLEEGIDVFFNKHNLCVIKHILEKSKHLLEKILKK